MARLVAAGDNVVDCYPQHGVMYPGGNAVNVAVNAARLGTSAAYVGVVGSDAAGEVVRTSLELEGVDLRRLRTVDGRNAAATVRVVDGNREFVGGDAGVSRFRLDDADLALMREADVVHTGECSMLEVDLVLMREASRVLSFDFSERPLEYVQQHASYVDVAVLSRPRAGLTQAQQLAHAVAEIGPRTVAVTRGPQGAVLLARGRLVSAAAGPADVVDTLGAGDAFIARLLVGLVAGESAEHLVASATAYASSTCSFRGAFGHESPLRVDPPGLAQTSQ